MQNTIPISLSEENALQTLLVLQTEFELLYGKSSITKGDVPVDQIGQSISEFIDIIQFSLNLDFKNYILKRLLSLKSTTQVLAELNKYLPIRFTDLRMDSTGLSLETHPNSTFYSPKILNLVMESLSIDNISYNFLDVIEVAFRNLLYFIEYKLTIEELIYNISIDINDTLSKRISIPIKRIVIEDPYYKNYINP